MNIDDLKEYDRIIVAGIEGMVYMEQGIPILVDTDLNILMGYGALVHFAKEGLIDHKLDKNVKKYALGAFNAYRFNTDVPVSKINDIIRRDSWLSVGQYINEQITDKNKEIKEAAKNFIAMGSVDWDAFGGIHYEARTARKALEKAIQ